MFGAALSQDYGYAFGYRCQSGCDCLRPVRSAKSMDSSGGELKRSTPDSELSHDLLHEFVRAFPQLDHDTTLCGLRFFQISKLTLEQCWIHEMSAPVSE